MKKKKLLISFFPLSEFKTLFTRDFVSLISSVKPNVYVNVQKSTAYLTEIIPRLQYSGRSADAF